MDKKSARTRFGRARAALLTAIDGLGMEEMTVPKVEGIWTIKDLMGHLVSWEEALLIPLRNYAQGSPFIPESIPDHDAWNAAQASRKRELSIQTIKSEMVIVRQEILRIAEQLAAQQWKEVLPAPWGGRSTIAHMIDGLAWHEEEHLKSILDWKENGTR